MSTKPADTTAKNSNDEKRAPGEGVALEPTIIAEQHRKPTTGPKVIPKASPDESTESKLDKPRKG